MSTRDSALAWPPGEVSEIDRIASQLALVATTVDQTVVAREGGQGWGLARSWSGPAFEAARSEAAVVASRSGELAGTLTPIVAALQGYAAALAEARRRVTLLRQEWDWGARRHDEARHDAELAGTDPVAVALGAAASQRLAARQEADRAWARLQEDLRGRHTAALGPLTAAAERATATVRGFLAALPGDDAVAVRGGLLAQLPLTAGALRLADARALIGDLVSRAGRPVQEWGAPEADLIATLGDRVRDPVVAQALMKAVPPEHLGRLVERLLANVASVPGADVTWKHRFDPALDVLGSAFLVLASQDPWAGMDEASVARLDSWRRRWLADLVDTGPGRIGDPLANPPFRGFTAQAVLLDHGRRSVPSVGAGTAYAATVGVALVEADRISDDYPPQAQLPWAARSAADGVEPIASLLRSIRGEPNAASALLLARLGDGQPVVRYLAGERLVRGAGGPPPAANEALAALLAETATGTDERSVTIAGAALDGFGAAAEHPERAGNGDAAAGALALDGQMQGLRFVMADLLARHPDAAWASVNDPINALAWPIDDADGHPWAVLGADAWTLRLLNRSRLAAVLGELGKDRLHPGTAASGPPTAPALAHLLNALVAAQGVGLAQALASGNAQDQDAQIVQLGQVTGFVIEAARQSVLTIQAGADAEIAARREFVDSIVAMVSLPVSLKASLPAALTAPLLGLVKAAIKRIGYSDGSVDNAATADAQTAAARARLDDDLRHLGWDLVSAAGWWDVADDPVAWIEAHPGVSFCGEDGRPVPVEEMSAAQRERFRAWTREVPAYTTVPSAIVEQIEEGARAVRTAIAGR